MKTKVIKRFNNQILQMKSIYVRKSKQLRNICTVTSHYWQNLKTYITVEHKKIKKSTWLKVQLIRLVQVYLFFSSCRCWNNNQYQNRKKQKFFKKNCYFYTSVLSHTIERNNEKITIFTICYMYPWSISLTICKETTQHKLLHKLPCVSVAWSEIYIISCKPRTLELQWSFSCSIWILCHWINQNICTLNHCCWLEKN